MESLASHHLRLISESAIAPHVAAERGYRTVTDAAELRARGFAEWQCHQVPALEIPIWDVTGRNGLYQIRPDVPRERDGKPAKYELPAGARQVLDVPPSVRPHLGNPAIPLHITEGARKVDSAVSHGLCCIGVNGVYGWRGRNDHGGKTALGDWEAIALNDRDVRIAFDSDVMTKATVRAAIERCAAFLRSRGATVRFVLLPAGPDGEKTGLDDYFAAEGTEAGLDALTCDVLPKPDTAPPYPVHAFPPKVARFIRDVAAILPAPSEFVGLPLMGFAAGVIGNTRYIEAKRGYRQPAVLWLVPVGPPGSAKTPAAEAARQPAWKLQQATKADWDKQTAIYERELADWQDLKANDRAKVAKPKPPPPLEHVLTTDSTKEALAVMASTSAGMTTYRDEISAWVAAFDAYRAGRGGDRQDMLSLWSGVPLKIDRKSAPPIIAEHPAVSIVGGIQPDRLRTLAGEAGQDGFLDRFLWGYPDTEPMRWTTAEVDASLEQDLADLFAKLRVALDDDHRDGWPVRFLPDTAALWAAWYEENADAQEFAPPAMRGVYAKAPNQLLRLALVLHSLTYPEPERDTLAVETLAAAIELLEYHLAHAARVMAHFPTAGAAHFPGIQGRIIRIIQKYEQENPDKWMSRSAIFNGLRTVNVADFNTALSALERQEVLERRVSSTATKPVEQWRIRKDVPFVLSDYSDYSLPEEGNSGSFS